jgi:hypothetical protein
MIFMEVTFCCKLKRIVLLILIEIKTQKFISYHKLEYLALLLNELIEFNYCIFNLTNK